MLLAQVSRTLDSSHGFDSSGKGNRELCESECTPDGPIAATSSEEIATKRASKKHETTQVAQSQRKERTPVDFELIEKSMLVFHPLPGSVQLLNLYRPLFFSLPLPRSSYVRPFRCYS